MGEYYSCRGCGNQEVGDTLYQCRKCTKIYCSSCGTWDKTKCPRCGDQTILFAPTIGSIESRSSDDSSSDSGDDISSLFNDDDDMDSMVSKALCYLRARKDTMSSFRKEKVSEFLRTLDWSEYPDAEALHDELNS